MLRQSSSKLFGLEKERMKEEREGLTNTDK
jgi:hypothetical protein